MVVKVPMSASGGSSSAQRSAQRVLKKYGLAVAAAAPNSSSPAAGSVCKRSSSSDSSYWRLKRIVPAISEKENISKLDVVLEAINYIQALQGNLTAAAVAVPAAAPDSSSRVC